jgi:ParB family chromosome partitioning protein
MGHARALLALEGEQQVEIAQLVAKKKMTVRQTEQLVKKCLQPEPEAKTEPQDAEAQQMSQKLSEMLGGKVAIVRGSNGKSKVTISLDEPHKLEQLIAKLES